MIISNQRIRLAIDTSQMGAVNDLLTGATPQFWNGVDLQFELAIFYGATLAAVSNLDSITVDLKTGDPRTGLPLMSQTIASGSLNQSLTLAAWQGGAATDCHALLVFANHQTALNLSGDVETFWLVISALTNDSPAHKLVLGATPLNVTEGGEGVTPPASVVSPTYYTAAQSDARYSRAVDLTSINTHLSTLDSEMTAATGTANAALPKTGGTLSGALTITSLSGVLKAASGLISGSATTSDLTEGSRLYWTQARFNTALAVVSGAVSGVCPLDSNSLIPTQYLPAITVHNTFVVASHSAMLALAAHQGDVAIRTDLNESFILINNTPAVLGNWSQLLTPASAVTSVNGQTGAVTLTTTNVSEGANLYHTTARTQAAALTAALSGFSNATAGNVTAGDSVLTALGRLENRTTLNDVKLTGSDRVLKAGDTMTGSLQFSGAANPGVILSNLNDTQRAALTPSSGMVIYNTTLSQAMIYNGAWQPLAVGSGTIWFSGTGAPGAGVGANGNYYLNTTNGDVYLKASGSWAIAYSPSTAALPTAGGTMSGPISFGSSVSPAINFGSAVYAFFSGTTWGMQMRSGGYNGFTITDNGSSFDLSVPNGNVQIGSGFGLQVNGIQVVTSQQAAITTTDNTTGDTTCRTQLNAVILALRAHGLIHA